MRIMVTLRSPHGSDDLLVDAHPQIGLGDLLKSQDVLPDDATPIEVTVDGRVQDPGTSLADAQLTDGATITVWPAHATPPPQADGPVPVGNLDATMPGQLRYYRPPRQRLVPVSPPTDRPVKPSKPSRPAFQWFIFAAPAVGSAVFAIFLRQPSFLLFAAMSPAVYAGNQLMERRRGSRSHRAELADFESQTKDYGQRLAAAEQADLSRRLREHPDPQALLQAARLASGQLWERQSRHDDFLDIRVGTGDVPWPSGDPAMLGRRTDQSAFGLRGAPVTLPLPGLGVVGITGSQAHTRAMARSMVLSLAVLHSPADVALTVLTQPDTEADWDWIRWLPHARQPESADWILRIGNDRESVARRGAELTEIVRSGSQAHPAGAPMRAPPADVVVLDGALELRRSLPALDELLTAGPARKVYFICLETHRLRLPDQCEAVVVLDDQSGRTVGLIEVSGSADQLFEPSLVPTEICAAAARAMAPIRDGGGRDSHGTLPSSVRFLDLARLEPPTPERILSLWQGTGQPHDGRAAPGQHWAGRTTRMPLGWGAGGRFELDLADSSHLMVAGTTGSGKSELLRTLVASLALANRPDAMNFALIDFKGGAAFDHCKSLPHTVGVLTDLDAPLVDRAITSLKAELRVRERLVAQAQVSDITGYWNKLPSMPGADPMPRLVIVVDEFAVLAAQLPHQLESLVDIGRRGRSLGIHLVLATQLPAGVVSASLRTNINLRIALRFTDAADSIDVIGTKDAAQIPTGIPGRAFARLGSAAPVAFQAACISGLRPDAHSAVALSTLRLGWDGLGHRLPAPPRPSVHPDDPTDLSLLVSAIAGAAERGEYARPRLPWHPPLPGLITLDEVTSQLGSAGAGPGHDMRLVFGLIDQPAEQAQFSAVLDLASGGHLLVGGAPHSGRTTLLRALAASLCARVSSGDAHLYVIDCGGGVLAPLAGLAHCGAVVTPDEPERVSRLLARLRAEHRRRRGLLSAEGCANLTELRQARPTVAPPYLLLLVDAHEAFVTALEHYDGGRLTEELRLLVRDSSATGIKIVITGDRSLLASRLAGSVADKIALRLADPAEYGLVGVKPVARPSSLPTGRGFRSPRGDMLQVALLAGQPSSSAQNSELRELSSRIPRPDPAPFRIDALPDQLSYSEARQHPQAGRRGIFVGVGGDELSQVHADANALLVLGAPGSGRSSALAVQVQDQAEAGRAVVLIAPGRGSRLSGMVNCNVRLVLTDSDATSAAKLTAALASGGPAIIAVDDAELLQDSPLGEALGAQYRQIRDSGHIVIAATTIECASRIYRGIISELAREHCGLVLAPAETTDGSPLNVRLSAVTLAPGHLLRGALVIRGHVLAVQIPELPYDQERAERLTRAEHRLERPDRPLATQEGAWVQLLVSGDDPQLAPQHSADGFTGQPLAAPGDIDIQRVQAVIQELGLMERHFHDVGSRYRLVASGWLLCAFTGIGYLLTRQDLPVGLNRSAAVAATALAGVVGILLIWNMDLLASRRLLDARFDEIRRLEGTSMLPLRAAGFITTNRVLRHVAYFYIGSAGTLLMLTGLAALQWSSARSAAAVAAVSAISLIAVAAVTGWIWLVTTARASVLRQAATRIYSLRRWPTLIRKDHAGARK